jgi:hypothetical protein
VGAGCIDGQAASGGRRAADGWAAAVEAAAWRGGVFGCRRVPESAAAGENLGGWWAGCGCGVAWLHGAAGFMGACVRELPKNLVVDAGFKAR